LAREIVGIELTSVVLPTPGPPVITSNFEHNASLLWGNESQALGNLFPVGQLPPL